MNASCQKLLPLYTPDISDQVIDLPVEKPPLILITEKEYLELKSEVGYWQAMHKKAISREKKLKQTIKEREGQIRDLRNRLFGKKSEKKSSSKDEGQSKSSNTKRPRGQQPCSEGHGRTKRPDLPEKKESANFSKDPICPDCGKSYIPDESKEAEIIDFLFV
jgi:transposase